MLLLYIKGIKCITFRCKLKLIVYYFNEAFNRNGSYRKYFKFSIDVRIMVFCPKSLQIVNNVVT